MAISTVTITTKSVNYTFSQRAITLELDCSKIMVIGIRTVSAFNALQDLERKVLLLINYSGTVYGLEGFKTEQSFLNYMNRLCCKCEGSRDCPIMINNCLVTINGCFFTINK